jgi:hypothetical protein
VKRKDQAAMDAHLHSLHRHYATSSMTNTWERSIPHIDAGVSFSTSSNSKLTDTSWYPLNVHIVDVQ